VVGGSISDAKPGSGLVRGKARRECVVVNSVRLRGLDDSSTTAACYRCTVRR
jgi:hypothetical protein